MTALAYLFPPLSGLIAYAVGGSGRVRWHGLQSVIFGAVWPAAIYLASTAGPLGTRIAFALGLLLWIGLFLASAFGFDPYLPGGRLLRAPAGYVDEDGEAEEVSPGPSA